ncbi:MAG: alpha/beta fold hydrolase [Candidatus Hodarchaeota archaeon]
MPIIKCNDIDINYIKKGEGEPLVLIQGTNTKLQAWNFQIEFFMEKMMVIAFDNRGAGKSSRPNYPYTMEMYLDDTISLLKALQIQDKIHLCGYSLGGKIALNLALKYPVKIKTLLLIATEPYTDPMKPKQTIEFYYQFDKMSFEEKMNTVFRLVYTRDFIKKLKQNQNLYNLLKKDMNILVYTEDPPRLNDYINQFKAIENNDIRNSIHKITHPTLIIVGDKDVNTPSEGSRFMHEKIANSKLIILENLKHGLLLEQPEKLNEIMWSFLKDYIG